jgi:hypothetical protein
MQPRHLHDREVWDFAREHGYVIVSKDSDFRQYRIPLRRTAEGDLGTDGQRDDNRNR